uniref:DUF630 domain-containing protein n=1 Tax=Heligmosomoides polygyrus TaxID=6339 RepID=A0A183FQI2_HELPZ
LVPRSQLAAAVRQAMEEVEIMFNQTEKHLQRVTSDRNFSSAELSWAQYTKGDHYSKYLSFSALISIKTTQHAARISSNSGILDILPFLTLERSDLLSSCPVSLIEECAAEKYRAYTGHCNNVNRPQFGAVYEPFRRLLPPDYEDNISSPRASVTKAALPSASDVAAVFTPAPRGHVSCSMMLAQWASFVYDDLVHVPSNGLVKDNEIPYLSKLPGFL